MTALSALWLPIVVSAVLVFVVSSVIHMAPLWHKTDFPPMVGEDRVRAALGPLAIPPGDYMVPRPASGKEMRTPEFAEKLRQGPVMLVTVMPNGPISMGKNLSSWFAYCVLVGALVALVAGAALPIGAPGAAVFRVAALGAFAAHVIALWQLSIWYRRAWSLAVKETVDGLIYALVTAGTFAWLWPR